MSRSEFRETTEAGLNLGWFLIIMAFVLVVIGGIFTVAHLGLLPFVRQQETAINRSSQGYVEAKQQQLLGMAQDYRRTEADIAQKRQASQDTSALEAQQRATLDRMQTEAALLSPSDVPDPVQVILNKNGRRI